MNELAVKEVLKERIFPEGLIVEVDEYLGKILGLPNTLHNSSRVVGVTIYENGIVLLIEHHKGLISERIFVKDQEKVIRWLFEKRIISIEKELINLNQLKTIFYGDGFSSCEFCKRIRQMVDDNLR